MRIVVTYGGRDRIVNVLILNSEAIVNRNGTDSTGRLYSLLFQSNHGIY